MMASDNDKRSIWFGLAPMSGVFRVVSIAYVLLAAGVPVAAWLAGPRHLAVWTTPITALVLWGILAMTWGIYRPRRFEVSDQKLIISWPLRRREIPVSSIAAVRQVDKPELGWMMRMFGVGGLFGGFGRFRSQHMGAIDVYVSRRDGLVLIALKQGRPVLITPDRPGEFVQALADRLR